MNKNVEFHPLEEHTGKTSASIFLLLGISRLRKGRFTNRKAILTPFFGLCWHWQKNPDIQLGYFVTDFVGGAVLMFVYINSLPICNEWGKYIQDFLITFYNIPKSFYL